MKHNKLISITTTGLIYFVGAIGLASIARAGSLTPDSFDETIKFNETFSIDRTVTLDAAPEVKLDVLFIADNTGSMEKAISNVQTNATTLLNNLSTAYNDVEIGIARYHGDPQEYRYKKKKKKKKKKSGYSWYESDELVGAQGAYELLEPVSGGTQADAVAAINTWEANSTDFRMGGDWPEASLFALHQAASSGGNTNSGFSSGYNTQWRSDAQKVIVYFGDAESHTNTVDVPETILALKNQGIKVIALSTAPTYLESYGYYDIDGENKDQASKIAAQTGGIFESVNSDNLSSRIETLIKQVVDPVTLQFNTVGDTSGLEIEFICTDTQGCSNVEAGESRDFRMDIKGIKSGVYDFQTVVESVDGAVSNDKVTVTLFTD